MKRKKIQDTNYVEGKKINDVSTHMTPEPIIKEKSTFTRGGVENVINKLRLSLGDFFTESDIEAVVPNLTKEKRVDVLNQLLIQNEIEVKVKKNLLVYNWKAGPSKQPNTNEISITNQKSEKLSGLNAQEKVVFSIVKGAGNKGISMKDIRLQSNILPNQLNKFLSSMESRKVIKSVKCVSAPRKKMYMLCDLEPDATLTGGSWYHDQIFESEFVDVLSSQCYRFLQELRKKNISQRSDTIGPLVFRNTCSALPKDVLKFISDLGISKIPLSEGDIRIILETLVYDRKVERENYCGVISYRAVPPFIYSTLGIGCIPCSICPIIDDCDEVPRINPERCQYLDKWLTKSSPAPLKLDKPKSPQVNLQIGSILKGVHGISTKGCFTLEWTSRGPQRKYYRDRCDLGASPVNKSGNSNPSSTTIEGGTLKL